MRKGVVERQRKPLMGCLRKVQRPADQRLNWAIQDLEKQDTSLGRERYSKKCSKIHQIQQIYVILSYMFG